MRVIVEHRRSCNRAPRTAVSGSARNKAGAGAYHDGWRHPAARVGIVNAGLIRHLRINERANDKAHNVAPDWPSVLQTPAAKHRRSPVRTRTPPIRSTSHLSSLLRSTRMTASQTRARRTTTRRRSSRLQEGERLSRTSADTWPGVAPATTTESLIPHMMCCCRGGGLRPLVRGMLLHSVKRLFNRIFQRPPATARELQAASHTRSGSPSPTGKSHWMRHPPPRSHQTHKRLQERACDGRVRRPRAMKRRELQRWRQRRGQLTRRDDSSAGRDQSQRRWETTTRLQTHSVGKRGFGEE